MICAYSWGSACRRLGKSVYVPPHLYGQLIQHMEGAEIVSNLPYLSDYFDIVRSHCMREDVDVKQCKAAIWAMVCATPATGLQYELIVAAYYLKTFLISIG